MAEHARVTNIGDIVRMVNHAEDLAGKISLYTDPPAKLGVAEKLLEESREVLLEMTAFICETKIDD